VAQALSLPRPDSPGTRGPPFSGEKSGLKPALQGVFIAFDGSQGHGHSLAVAALQLSRD